MFFNSIEKLTFSKLQFFRKGNVKKCNRFEEQDGKRLFWHHCFRLSQISFNLFCSGDKTLLSEFLKKWGWFHRHNEQFAQIPWLKLRYGFVDERTMITTTSKSSCQWKTLVPFYLGKSIFNTNNELSQIRTEKQIMLFKATVNWLFSYWLFCLKNWRFSTIVRVYYILKHNEI